MSWQFAGVQLTLKGIKQLSLSPTSAVVSFDSSCLKLHSTYNQKNSQMIYGTRNEVSGIDWVKWNIHGRDPNFIPINNVPLVPVDCPARIVWTNRGPESNTIMNQKEDKDVWDIIQSNVDGYSIMNTVRKKETTGDREWWYELQSLLAPLKTRRRSTLKCFFANLLVPPYNKGVPICHDNLRESN